MDLFPKFLIEDGDLIIRKVTYHKDILTSSDVSKVKGGGWFRVDSETMTMIFWGDSHDFGRASFEDIKSCIDSGRVFTDSLRVNNVSKKWKFKYDNHGEIINLS
jgi:hypothetical protein